MTPQSGAVWDLLAAGAARQNGFTLLSLATMGDGPRQRTVVLRAARPWHLEIWTDRRSAKCAEIAADARVSALGWDAGLSVQLSLSGTARMLTEGPQHAAAWAKVLPHQRGDYGGMAPGMALDAPGAMTRHLAQAEDCFAVIAVQVTAVDWLHLSPNGHRRARMTPNGTQQIAP